MNNSQVFHNESQIYDFSVMTCVDPDNLVFAQRVSDEAWTFYQVTNLDLLESFEGQPERLIYAYNGLKDTRAELNKSYSMVSFTVDLARENRVDGRTQKERYEEMYHDDWKYICCEEIFRENAVESIIENVLKQDPHYYE